MYVHICMYVDNRVERYIKQSSQLGESTIGGFTLASLTVGHASHRFMLNKRRISRPAATQSVEN